MSFNAEILADSPVLWLRADETSGATMADASGNGLDATLAGTYTRNVPMSGASGIGAGVTLGGSGSDYASIPDNALLDITGAVTYEAFVINSGHGDYQSIMTKGESVSGGLAGYLMRLDPSGYVQFLRSNLELYGTSTDAVPADGKTHQVAVTDDLTTIRFYIDGVLCGTATHDHDALANSEPFHVGVDWNGASTSYPLYGGALAEVLVFDSALSAARIAAHYVAALDYDDSTYDLAVANDAPFLYWKLDETSGTTAADSSGNSETGTYSGATLSETALDGGASAASFGSSGYVVSANSEAGNFGADGEIALDGWIDYDGTLAPSGQKIIVASFLSAIGGANWDKTIFIDDAGHACFYVYDGSPETAVGATVLSAGVHHLAGEFDNGAGRVRIYVDGVLDGEVSATLTQPSASHFALAATTADASWHHAPAAWVYDDWAAYGHALGPLRVAAHYAAGTGGGGGAAPVVTSFTPASGPWYTSVVITGTDFTGATDVQFNGTSASFTVDSPTQITAEVPVGATDGVITVVTPDGSDDSSTSFDVTPLDDGDTTPAVHGGVRVSIAFDDGDGSNGALIAKPVWTDVTALSRGIVAGYTLHRGREFELDYTDTGDYTVRLYDKDGILDPTNVSGPLYGEIDSDLQIKVELWNPVAEEWRLRFRGWIENYSYDIDPAQTVATLEIACYDIFALLSTVEMQPGEFGDPVPAAAAGNLFFDNAVFQDRIIQVLTNAGLPAAFYVVFSGNVWVDEGIYSPGDTPMNVVQDALDAEFPGVSNAYPDRLGRFVAHGRLAKFDPSGTWSAIAPTDGGRNAVWHLNHWKLGDAAAIAGDPSTVQLRVPYSWSRGRAHIINSAMCYPKSMGQATNGQARIAAQYIKDPTSIGIRGYASWSRENVLIESGILTGNDGAAECKLFSTFYVANYAEPRNRPSALTVMSIHPDDPRAGRVWALLTLADIADTIDLTVAHPGGGGFNAEPFFIEGITEECVPATASYPMVTMTLDVSPAAYFDNPEGLDGN